VQQNDGSTWAIKIQWACSELLWMMRLNLLWIGFTLAGGLILGLGPATVAAYALARRHATGESIQTAEFWAVYRGEFGRGSLLVLPAVALITVLTGDYLYFSALGPGATAPRLVTLAALLSAVIVAAYLLPMYVHYDLRPSACLAKAPLFALAHPAASILLLFAFAVDVQTIKTLPVLAPILGVGVWIQFDTWLCLRFFAENEARLDSKGDP
jgi:Predicted integral membrane protein